MTVPLWILAGAAVVVGFFNMPEHAGSRTASRCASSTTSSRRSHFPEIEHPEFSFLLAALLDPARPCSASRWPGSTSPGTAVRTASPSAARRPPGATASLENKYYLDWLYTTSSSAAIKGPIARGVYWFNQNVIDGVVNGAGIGPGSRRNWLYSNIDQGVVDGIVNGSGAGAEGSGQVLRRIQTGKVQQYAAFLFAGAAVLAGIFIFII